MLSRTVKRIPERIRAAAERVRIGSLSELPPLTATGLHHIGMSVADLDAALAFWQAFVGVEARWRTVLDRPYLGRHVGYPGVSIEAAFLDLPGGAVLELLEYRVDGKAQNPEATANPGNVHVCLLVEDTASAWQRAVALGARPLVAEGPVEVDAGPNRGALVAYLRIHDGITLELYQRP
jgi:catechol 2,3-dioxygenase-like lactoylglutathione lyase family enzyme